MSRPTKKNTNPKVAKGEALPARGRDLVNWLSDMLPRVSEYHSIERLSEAVTLGGNRDLLRRSLLGEASEEKEPRPLKLIEAVRLANELNIHIGDLLRRFGFKLDLPTAPIRGHVNAFGEISTPDFEARVPSPMSGYDMQALEMHAPGPWNRAVFFFRRAIERTPNDTGRLVVAKPLKLERPYLCTLTERKGGLEIEPFNRPANKFIDGVEWSSPVLWIKLA